MSKPNKSRKARATTTRPWLLFATVAVFVVLVIVSVVFVLSRGKPLIVTGDVNGQPNLVVDKKLVDFGNVRFEKPVTAVFNISNTGDKPLQILGEPRVELLQGC